MYTANVLSVKFTYYNFLFKNHDTNCIKINLLYAKGILYVLNSLLYSELVLTVTTVLKNLQCMICMIYCIQN